MPERMAERGELLKVFLMPVSILFSLDRETPACETEASALVKHQGNTPVPMASRLVPERRPIRGPLTQEPAS